MPADPRHERRALLVSIAATAALGVLGVIWGLVVGSQMILLDGAYAIVGIVLSALLLRASAVTEAGPTRRYHYGREAATPLVIAVQGLVLLGTLLYAALGAVAAIGGGGTDVDAGSAVVYSVIVTVASLGTWVWLRARSAGSELLAAEATAWRIAALRGVGMIVGFSLMVGLDGTRWDEAVPYIDPSMVLITCALFVWTPLGMVRRTVVELLQGAPDEPVQSRVDAAVAEAQREHGFGEPEIRVAKIGPKLFVEIAAQAAGGTTIAEEHAAREEVRGRLEEALPYEIWLTLELFPDEG